MSVPSYPLYDELYQRYQTLDEGINLAVTVSTINNLKIKNDREVAHAHYEEITALILHYWLTEVGPLANDTFPYPHKVMYQGNGLSLNFKDFPPTLQGIIALYVASIPVQE